ncbi:MAG: IS1182 family transposase [Spirochaetales bacterium]|nr:IS1182 family transposase [Spirochaetales bacterium]
MSARFVNVDRDTPMLLPPSLKDWVAENDMVHFVIEAVEGMELHGLKVNRQGGGSPQYPPRMMLALLIYCYANGIMSSRKIERATWNLVSVRYLTGDTHPDHDTINSFRKANKESIERLFTELLILARNLGFLKVGTVSVDGTHIKANASKYKNVRYDRAGVLEKQIADDVAELLKNAEEADTTEKVDGQSLPEEIGRREVLRQKMIQARLDMEERAREREKIRQEKEKSKREYPPDKKGSGRPKKERIDAEEAKPEDDDQINLVDKDSTLCRKSRRDAWEQAYNAQAVVDADGSRLILASYVAESTSDRNELEPALKAVVPEAGKPSVLLADAGYVNTESIKRIEESEDGPELYIAVTSEDHGLRRYDYRPPKEPRKNEVKDPVLIAMREKVLSEKGRKIYGKRKSTVEPVFGIIKSILGFRQFLRRGFGAVDSEWKLVCAGYNIKRLWTLQMAK